MRATSAPETSTGTPSLGEVVGQLIHDFRHGLGAGDLADLRRLGAEAAPPPAFWRLAALRLEPAGQLRPFPDIGRDEAERRWAVVLAAMASLGGDLLARGRSLGRALAAADVSEHRFLRLLRAQGPLLWSSTRAVVHQLVGAAEPVDPVDLAWLVLSDGRDFAEGVRRRIARDYFRAVSSEGSSRKETPA